RDSAAARVARRREADLFALDEELALVLRMHARKDLDQARLPGAVVAEDARHLARVDVQRDIAERDDVAVELRDPLRCEQVRRLVHLIWPSARARGALY